MYKDNAPITVSFGKAINGFLFSNFAAFIPAQHPEAPIQPEINYFRCYPVIDEQGEGWYLHFFCRSGEGNDAKLKSMF